MRPNNIHGNVYVHNQVVNECNNHSQEINPRIGKARKIFKNRQRKQLRVNIEPKGKTSWVESWTVNKEDMRRLQLI